MRRQRFRMGITLISLLLFPVTFYYFSPVLILEAASQGIVAGSFLVFAGLFVTALLFGRAFCGWLCPVGGLLDICALISDKPARGGRLNWIKYIIWVLWIALIVILALSAGGLHRIEVTYQTTYGISLMQPHAYIIYYSLLGLFVLLSLTAGKRAFCHYGCWMAPFMVLGTRIKDFFGWPSLRIAADRDRCTRCGRCSQNCTMSLPVEAMVAQGSVADSECILCGKCIDSCPKKAISYTWSSRKSNRVPVERSIKREIN